MRLGCVRAAQTRAALTPPRQWQLRCADAPPTVTRRTRSSWRAARIRVGARFATRCSGRPPRLTWRAAPTRGASGRVFVCASLTASRQCRQLLLCCARRVRLNVIVDDVVIVDDAVDQRRVNARRVARHDTARLCVAPSLLLAFARRLTASRRRRQQGDAQLDAERRRRCDECAADVRRRRQRRERRLRRRNDRFVAALRFRRR